MVILRTNNGRYQKPEIQSISRPCRSLIWIYIDIIKILWSFRDSTGCQPIQKSDQSECVSKKICKGLCHTRRLQCNLWKNLHKAPKNIQYNVNNYFTVKFYKLLLLQYTYLLLRTTTLHNNFCFGSYLTLSTHSLCMTSQFKLLPLRW